MAETHANGSAVALDINDGVRVSDPSKKSGNQKCFSYSFAQKLIAELFGTYFLIYAGCMSVTVNLDNNKVVSLPGISIVWGLAVMALVYSTAHVSGAHFNPAVTIAFATCKRFPWKEVPAYVVTQAIGSTLAAGTIRLLYPGALNKFNGTQPAGSDLQSLVIEFIITFYLLYVISGVCTDERANGQFGAIAVGATVLINVMFAGPTTGASMNPARSLGPAIVHGHYKSLWVYILGPILGGISGAWVYNTMRSPQK